MSQILAGALRAFDLSNRVAIVTGASSGLGAALAKATSSLGAKVVLVGRRKQKLSTLADEIGGLAMPCDLLNESELCQLVPSIYAKVGPPEILINVAGDIFSRDPAESEPLSAIRRTFELNVIAPFKLSQDVYPHMRELGRGAILNISSISGIVGMPGVPQASYAASKRALSGLTTELAVQWGPKGIRVNTLAPGFFESEINTELYRNERFRQWLSQNTTLAADARFEDFEAAVLWLISDASRHVTGQTITIDGGWTIR